MYLVHAPAYAYARTHVHPSAIVEQNGAVLCVSQLVTHCFGTDHCEADIPSRLSPSLFSSLLRGGGRGGRKVLPLGAKWGDVSNSRYVVVR